MWQAPLLPPPFPPGEGDARACIDRDGDRLLRRLRSRDASQPLAQLRGLAVVQGDHSTSSSDLQHVYATPAVYQGKSLGKSLECVQASIEAKGPVSRAFRSSGGRI